MLSTPSAISVIDNAARVRSGFAALTGETSDMIVTGLTMLLGGRLTATHP